METVYKYGAAISSVDWRNKNKLHLTDFSTRKKGLLIKSEYRTTTMDLAIYLGVENEDIIKLIDTSKYEKGICKRYQPGEMDVNKYEKIEYYWINSMEIEKLVIGLKERL